MLMPFVPVRLPSCLQGQQNGEIDRALLAAVDSPDYGRLMVKPVARAMRALHAHALTAGITLATTGRGRTLMQQWSLFDARYEPCTYLEYLVARAVNRHKRWKPAARAQVAARLGVDIPASEWWRKRQNPNGSYPATAATPGTSNHGWLVADDLAEIRFGKRVSLTENTRQWLYQWAPLFGFTWESKAEPWHVSWAYGDDIPPALYWGSEMQRIALRDDIAILKLSGEFVEWIQDGNVSAALAPLTGPVIILDRPAFATMHGTGDFPHPTKLLPTDFASWVP